jgi:subtilisin family serine protease
MKSSITRGLIGTIAITAQAALFLYTPSSLGQPAASAPAHAFATSRSVPGRYIVVFKSTVVNPAATAAGLMQGNGGRMLHSYGSAIKGFSATLPDAAVQALRNNPNVESIEQDHTVSLTQVTSPQNQVTWGLDRIDQADRPLDTQYHFGGTGAGVNAFIIDTGIRTDHQDFTGRLLPGYNVVADGNGTNDCNGHGTHVAGTVGGTTWGVAKGVSVVPVRVLNCAGSGTWSDVIAGIDWVANSPLRPAVANLSLGGSASTALDAAVAGAVAKGVTMVVAAGNSNLDACNYSPAREPSAITVGASNSMDSRSYFSNIGACLDIFAPGENITSAWYTAADASRIMSGTSMASPHVAGVAALTLQSYPTASPAAVAASLMANATPNRLVSVGTASPNLLVYSAGGNAPPAQPSTRTVAFKSMVGASSRTGGNWKASAAVTVRDVNSGATVANATVDATFSPGGNARCVTGADGSCILTSGSIKSNAAPSTTLSGTGISGTLMNYDVTQNTVTQIVIGKP